MSKNELSNISGIDRKYINDIESGKYAFSIDVIAKLSIALDFYIFFIPKDSDSPLAEVMRNKLGKIEGN